MDLKGAMNDSEQDMWDKMGLSDADLDKMEL